MKNIPHCFFVIVCNADNCFVTPRNTNIKHDAIKKRTVAKVMGGSSCSPILITIHPKEKIQIETIIIANVSLSIPEEIYVSLHEKVQKSFLLQRFNF